MQVEGQESGGNEFFRICWNCVLFEFICLQKNINKQYFLKFLVDLGSAVCGNM